MRWVVCENLRSAYNVGSIIRTADGLGWGVILVGYTAPKEHRKVVKTALGAEESIPLLQFKTVEEFWNWVKEYEVITISAEITSGSISLDQFNTLIIKEYNHKSLNNDYCIIVGNEITGVEKETLDRSDYIVYIPLHGIKESLNVCQAAAIVMWTLGESNKT